MTDDFAGRLRAFLHPKRVDETALRATLEAVPAALRRRFLAEARGRLAALERTLRPLSEHDGAEIRGPDYPTATFTSEDQVLRIAAAIEAVRRKRRLLDARADTWRRPAR